MMSLQSQLAAFDAELPIERAWTPPSSWYTSPELYALERRTLFPASWQPVARVDELEEVGSWRAGCLAGEPWLLTRAADGLRAFSNVCRHKGREVVTGRGSGPLVCGYHGWRYGLDGRLESAPRIAGIRDFAKEEMGLVPLRLEVWGPFVWICGDASAPGLAASHPELAAALAASGWEQLVFHSAQSWELACNWKVYVDNYLDGGYHVPHMHPSLAAQIDMASYRTECFAQSSIQSAGPRSGTDAALGYDPAERIGGGAVYGWLFPNVMLNRYGPCLDSNHVVPLGPERCRVDYAFFFAPEVDGAEDFVAASIAQAAVTQREDIEICESVQVGLGSRHYERGRYAPRVEQGEHHFHRLLAAALGKGLRA